MRKQDKTYIAIAGVTILGTLAGFIIVKKLKDKKKEKESLIPGNTPLPNLPSSNTPQNYSSNTSTIPTPDYAALTERLLDAMKGWGTDEEAIFNTLRLLRVGQLQGLIDYFNKTQEKTLQWWLKDELDSGEMEQIKKIWTKHGLTI